MSASASSGRHILLAEPDRSQSQMLATMLQLEGYSTEGAFSLEEALTRVDAYPYDLVLTDLFIIHPPPRLEAAQQLQRSCQPTPVGILTAWPLTTDEAAHEGFAFLLQRPFELDVLLERIAALLNPPFTPEQAQHTRLIRRHLEALSQGNWEVLRTLCTPDVGYYPLTGSLFALAREIRGIDAYLTYAQQVRSRLPDFRIERVVIFYHPLDIVARARVSWRGHDGARQGLTGSVICRFRGERIFQIGVSFNWHRLQALLDPSREPPDT
jgi:CheY-like chemotaxis protein